MNNNTIVQGCNPLYTYIRASSAKRDIYTKPTASREAAQLWGRCMDALLYGSAKRDLFILSAVDSVGV